MRTQNTSGDQSLPVPGFSYKRLSPLPPGAIPPFADPHLRWLSSRQSLFTRRARSTIVGACMAVVYRHSPVLDVEHVLLGILERTPGELFAAMFASDTTSSATLLRAVEAALAPVGSFQLEAIPVTVAVRNVVALARREASVRGYVRIGTGPLLLGLAREEQSLPGEVLAQHGMTYARLCEGLSPAAFVH